MNKKCAYCKKEIEGNYKNRIERLESIGYFNYPFCNDECLVRWILKKFKRKIRRMQL